MKNFLSIQPLPQPTALGGKNFMADEDLGKIDAIYMGFLLFGPDVESMYYFWFLFLFLSAVYFVLCFFADTGALLLLLFYCLSLYATMPWLNTGFPTAPYTFSVLSMIPALHILLLIFGKEKSPDAALIVCTIAQSLFLVFCVFCRGQVKWQLLAIYAASGVVAVKLLCSIFSKDSVAALPQKMMFRLWPCFLVLMLSVGLSSYIKSVVSGCFFQKSHNLFYCDELQLK